MNIWLASGLMLLGIAGHFVSQLASLEEEGKQPTPWGYVKSHPWRLINMLFACEVLIFLFQQLGELNTVTAILTGYTCQSASDNLRKRAEARMRPPPV